MSAYHEHKVDSIKLGSIWHEHHITQRDLSQIKGCLLLPIKFFLYYQNGTGYISNKYLHLQTDGAFILLVLDDTDKSL